jgi:nucleotide-binding universal stress UspA family protein
MTGIVGVERGATAADEETNVSIHILVPLDGSDLSQHALPWANLLAGALEAEIELLHVVPPDFISESVEAEVGLSQHLQSGGATHGRNPHEETARTAREEARRSLDAASHHLRGRTIRQTVLEGDPAESIIKHAREADTALIVMATHAREGLSRAVLGSVAGSVIRESGRLVLALRPGAPAPTAAPRRVLIPMDGSPLAAAVVPILLPLAAALRWSFTLLSVLRVPQPGLPVQGATIPLGSMEPEDPSQALDHLEEVAANIRSAGLAAETCLGYGDRVKAISQQAMASGCDLIAMSTHGRTGLERLAIGSVTDALIHQAPVPVIAVRPSHPDP